MFASFSLFSSILLIGGMQGILLSVFLIFGKTSNAQANKLLGLLTLAFSLNVIIPEFVKNYPQNFPHLIAVSFPLLFLFGPLFLSYVENLIISNSFNKKNFFISLIPFTISVIFLLPFFIQPVYKKLEFYNFIRSSGLPFNFILIWGLGCVHIIIYSFIIFRILKLYQEKIKNETSEISRINLEWLKNLTAGFSFVWAVYLFFFLIFTFGIATDPFGINDYLFGLILSILLYSIGYKGWKQPEIFHGFEAEKVKLNGNKKYAKSGLTNGKSAEYLQLLTDFMEKEKPYKNPDITLKELAENLNLHPNYISQIINEKLNQNFYDFINNYRIKVAVELLISNQDLNILEIAFESGFSSKSTFNTAFKKHTGKTPTEYKKLNK